MLLRASRASRLSLSLQGRTNQTHKLGVFQTGCVALRGTQTHPARVKRT